MQITLSNRRDLGMVSRIHEQLDFALSLQGFKEWMKWSASDTSEDNTMSTNLFAAAKQAEMFTGRVILRKTYRTFIEFFPSCLRMDVHPIDLTSLVVKYYDSDNALQTLTNTEYFVKNNGPDAYAEIIFDGTMPSLYDRFEPLYLEYTAGYSLGNIPEMILSGICKRATDLTENRSNESQGSINQTMYSSEVLWFPYKMLR